MSILSEKKRIKVITIEMFADLFKDNETCEENIY